MIRRPLFQLAMPSPMKEPPTDTPTARSKDATTTAALRAAKDEDCSFISASTHHTGPSFTKTSDPYPRHLQCGAYSHCFKSSEDGCSHRPAKAARQRRNRSGRFQPNRLSGELETAPSEIFPAGSSSQIN